MSAVASHAVNPFVSPFSRSRPVEANDVRGNDNVLRVAHNAHDADDTIHVQSGVLGDRPATAGEGAVWIDTDTLDSYIYLSGWKRFTIAAHTGAFYSDANQTASAANTATQTTINTTVLSDGVTLASNALTFGYAGTYHVEVKYQLVNTDGSIHDVWMWPRLNGTAIPYAGRRLSITERHGSIDGHAIGVGFFAVEVAANDVLTFWWETDSITTSLQALASATGRSGSPSFSVVVQRI